MKTLNCLNPSDVDYCDRAFHVQLGVFLSLDLVVIANCEQDAIDLIIDHYDNEDHVGWFLTDEDIDQLSEYQLEQYIYGGNYCKYMSFTFDELRITPVNIESVKVEVSQ